MRRQCERNRPFLWLLSGLLLLSQTMVAGHFHHDHQHHQDSTRYTAEFTPLSMQLLLANPAYNDHDSHTDEPAGEDYLCELCLHAYSAWSEQASISQPDSIHEDATIHVAGPGYSSQSVYRGSQPRAPPVSIPFV